MPSVFQLIEYKRLLGFCRVNLQNVVAEPDIPQAPLNNLQRRCFLRHEKNCLFLGNTLRDNICYCLALSRSRRTAQYEIFSGNHVQGGGELRGIRGKRSKNLRRRKFVIKLARFQKWNSIVK